MEPDTVRTDSATEARPAPSSGSAPPMPLPHDGLAARFSAALSAGRISLRSKVRADWAIEIAPTATSTMSTMSTWSRRYCPARVISRRFTERRQDGTEPASRVTVTTMTTTSFETAIVTAVTPPQARVLGTSQITDAPRGTTMRLHLTDPDSLRAHRRRRSASPSPPLRAAAASPTSPRDTAADSSKPLTDLRIMVPNSAGGGYDITARTAAKVMEDDKITSGTEVFNLEGAGGTVGLARTVNEKGNGDLADADGPRRGRRVVHEQVEGHARRDHPDREADRGVRRRDGAEGLAVQDDRRPGRRPGRPTRARSASAAAPRPAAPTTCCPMQLAQAVGIDPKQVRFVSYDGGGDLLPALLGDKIDFATSGAGEFKDQIANGDIRVLATSGDERIEGIDAPTLKEAGIDLVFTNWRGVVAPPGITDAQRDRLIAAFEKMHDTQEWKDALKANSWADAFETGDDFGAFLEEQDKRVADTLGELGLA